MTKKDKKQPAQEKILQGIGVSDGVAIGPAYVIDQHGVPVPEYAILSRDVDKEIKRFQTAVNKTQKQLSQLKQKAETLPSGANEELGLLLEAYKGMAASSRLLRGVEKRITENHINAEAAVHYQIAEIAASFAAMQDDYLAARANDVREVGARLIRNLLQQSYNPFADAPEGSLLLAEEITPADTALMDPARISGFAAALGGAEGHAAIMARALSLPAVLGVGAVGQEISTGDMLIIDGTEGRVVLYPEAETIRQYKAKAVRVAKERKKLDLLRDTPAITQDQVPVKMVANVELPRDAESALAAGAEGIGLLRTEFSFMNRSNLPTEDEQYEALVGLLDSMQGRPVTARTLDVGGEKLASALGAAVGESVNPALGLRAIRLGLQEPKLLDTQLAAMLRAAAHGPLRIMVPMVSSADQIRQVRERIVQVEKKLRRRGVKLADALPPLGAMIEIPAAALTADELSKVCDFFAIGSNDLTQYTLAIDRGDDRVAHLYNPYHPAVLRLIEVTIAAGWRANIPVSLCGELAGDPRATALMLGIGLREFSVAPSRLLQIKQQICSLNIPQTVAFAREVLQQGNEANVHALLDRGVA